MKKNKVTISMNLEKELDDYLTEFSVGMAAFVRDEMHECTKHAIDAFYNNYRPKNKEPLFYNRNYYNFRNNSFSKYYENKHGKIIRGGVELTPGNMDDIYRADTDYVFNLVYAGYHGSVWTLPNEIKNVPPVMNPGPLEILLNRRDEIVKNIDSYKSYGLNRASNKNYLCIKTY